MRTVHYPKVYSVAHPKSIHESTDARRTYADEARSAGITEAMDLVLAHRPAAALRRMARTVEAELAIEGLAGIRINVAEQMTRLIADKRRAEALAGAR